MTKIVERKRTALILAGAAAKGAFEAGALSVIAEKGPAIERIVGASAGSLNGAVFAAGIRCGEEREAASRLVNLWRDRADWRQVFDFNLRDIVGGRGASTMEKVRALLEQTTVGFLPRADRSIDLLLVLTVLGGQSGTIGRDTATTFEGIARFPATAFDTPAGWARICDAAVASASFPIAFEPADVEGFGACLDGGIVNNTPVKWALDGDMEQIIVVSATPRVVTPPEPFQGKNLLGEFVDILVDERLYRDLHDAEAVNGRLRQLDDMVGAGELTEQASRAVKRAFGWRHVKLISIRPDRPLSGNVFSGFFEDDKRKEYLDAGIEAARRVLC